MAERIFFLIRERHESEMVCQFFFSFKTLFKEKNLSMISIIEQDILNPGGSENETRSVFDVLETLTLKRAKKKGGCPFLFVGGAYFISLSFPLYFTRGFFCLFCRQELVARNFFAFAFL